jgi:hypothetical protein
MEVPGYKAPFTVKQSASKWCPLQFLWDLAFAVLNDETGNLLKYYHLIKHPKYKKVWTKSFGSALCRLATKTETIFFVQKDDIPDDRSSNETYARIV